jgi:membrane-associated phospholipid phosphatase
MQFTQLFRPKRAHLPACVWGLVVTFLFPLAGLAQQQPPLQPDQCSLSSPGHCVFDIARDQRGILTSPTRIRKKDFVWLLPLVTAAGATYAFDHAALQHVSTDPARMKNFATASNVTGIYGPVAAAGAAWLTGKYRHDDHLRETGALAMLAMVDTEVFTTFMKFAADRVRPQATGLGSEAGEFWPDGRHLPSATSFPSGHTADAFAVAHVIADEYPGWKVKLAVYGLAAATGFERVEARRHFPCDVLIGGTVGYLIGGYVFDHHSSRSKAHVLISPMMARGGGGVSVQFFPSH